MLTSLFVTVTIWGASGIDRMVEQRSSVGESMFATAVQRNPKTSKVEKVVKRLEVNATQAGKFVIAFRRETKRHDKSTTRNGRDGLTIVFVEENSGSNRIYMLKSDGKAVPDRAVITSLSGRKISQSQWVRACRDVGGVRPGMEGLAGKVPEGGCGGSASGPASWLVGRRQTAWGGAWGVGVYSHKKKSAGGKASGGWFVDGVMPES